MKRAHHDVMFGWRTQKDVRHDLLVLRHVFDRIRQVVVRGTGQFGREFTLKEIIANSALPSHEYARHPLGSYRSLN